VASSIDWQLMSQYTLMKHHAMPVSRFLLGTLANA